VRWRRGARSKNVLDERGQSPTTTGFGFPTVAKGGIPAVLVLLLALFLGGKVLGGGGGIPGINLPQANSPGIPSGRTGPDPDGDLVAFVSFVLDDVQTTWQKLFAQSGKTYRDAELVLFTDAVDTGCGSATSEVGPFYCPADQRVYLDLGFFRELRDRFGAPGDFAQAYVVAHELGHHVQNLLGVTSDVQQESRAHPNEANELSVKTELQADCLAGVWGYSTEQRDLLDPGDVQEGLKAAESVGDDRIQKAATGTTNPETWTHGSSEQRMHWFNQGFTTGDPASCDTFSG
jgi:predicted metalloprotease